MKITLFSRKEIFYYIQNEPNFYTGRNFISVRFIK